jgi:hypothetical protein
MLQGIVTAAQAAPLRTAWCASVLTYDELVYHKVPLYRGRDSQLDMAGYTHPYETKENALILWLATAIPVFDPATMEPVQVLQHINFIMYCTCTFSTFYCCVYNTSSGAC